jgi:hypothetical protein
VFYDLLLYNNVSASFRPFWGFLPDYELEYAKENAVQNNPKGDIDLDVDPASASEENVFSVKSLSDVVEIAESILANYAQTADSELTFRETDYAVLDVVNVVLVAYTFVSSLENPNLRRGQLRTVNLE